jgi:hypothetical protein
MDAFSAKQTQKPNFKQGYSPPPPIFPYPSPAKPTFLCPGQFKPGRLAVLQVDGPEWSTPRRFHCCHIYFRMLDNIEEAVLHPLVIS